MKLIDKSALVAEIDRRESLLDLDNSLGRGGMVELECLKDTINTLEVKEVDLEKEINKYICDNFFGSETIGFFANRTKEEPNDQDIALCAKHFFELGLKAQHSELTWEDISVLRKIMVEYRRQTSNEMLALNDEDYCKEVLNRFKAQKGE